jgi:hypothetical protein
MKWFGLFVAGLAPLILTGSPNIWDGVEKGFGLPFLGGLSGDNKRDYEQIDKGVARERSQGVR